MSSADACATIWRNHGSRLPGDRSRSRFRTQHLALASPDEAPLRPERAEEEVLRAVAQAHRHPHVVRQGHQGDRRARHRVGGPGPPGPWGEDLMAKQQDVRPIIKLRSTAGTGYTYVTRKNRRNNPDRLVLKKYDPVVRKHVDFREER